MISIHALREEGDSGSAASKTTRKTFLSTPSARRATPPLPDRSCRREHFYPRPPRGGRPEFDFSPVRMAMVFLSTPSARRATSHRACVAAGTRDFYPRPPRGGRPSYCRHLRWRASNFYPRPPRGGRPAEHVLLPAVPQFLSTPSARRATSAMAFACSSVRQFLSTPSARRATM